MANEIVDDDQESEDDIDETEESDGTVHCPDEIFSSKAPKQTTPGTKTLEGQYINDKGKVEFWKAYYDEYGRQMGRTDYNAGNKAQEIPDTHHHTIEYGPGKVNGMETGSHLPGEYIP